MKKPSALGFGYIIVIAGMALLLFVGLVACSPSANSSSPSQAVSGAPVASETVSVPSGAAPFETVIDPVTSTRQQQPIDWIYQVAEDAGLSFGTIPVYIQSGICGLGCTTAHITNGVVTSVDKVAFDPSIINTDQGRMVVLHELGHINGIVAECEADAFAYAHGAPHYPDAHCM